MPFQRPHLFGEALEKLKEFTGGKVLLPQQKIPKPPQNTDCSIQSKFKNLSSVHPFDVRLGPQSLASLPHNPLLNEEAPSVPRVERCLLQYAPLGHN